MSQEEPRPQFLTSIEPAAVQPTPLPIAAPAPAEVLAPAPTEAQPPAPAEIQAQAPAPEPAKEAAATPPPAPEPAKEAVAVPPSAPEPAKEAVAVLPSAPEPAKEAVAVPPSVPEPAKEAVAVQSPVPAPEPAKAIPAVAKVPEPAKEAPAQPVAAEKTASPVPVAYTPIVPATVAQLRGRFDADAMATPVQASLVQSSPMQATPVVQAGPTAQAAPAVQASPAAQDQQAAPIAVPLPASRQLIQNTRSASIRRSIRKLQSVQIVVDNRREEGSLVTDDEVRLMVVASNKLLRDVADVWGFAPPVVVFGGDLGARGPDPGAYLFHVIGEDTNVPDAFAYHTEEDRVIDGYILSRVIMTNGGVPLYDSKRPLTTPTVAGALFHELAEAFIDPTVNAWWQDANGVFYCAEICDPVQGNNVIVEANLSGKPAQKVALCDFVYPAWRDASAPDDGSVRMNHAGTLKAPFSVDHGGYVVKFDPMTDSGPQQVFGRRVAGWMRSMKASSQRNTRRASIFKS